MKIYDKNINVIQDGYLIAGTKQRVSELFVKYIIKKEKRIIKKLKQ